MSRNKQVDKLKAGMDELCVPVGGIVPKDPVDRALAMLKRNIILIARLQEERNTAVAQHTKINTLWRDARARYAVAEIELGLMRQKMVETLRGRDT